MHFKFIKLFLLSLFLINCKILAQTVVPIYKNPTYSTEERVQDLLQRMTPEEKFWQCFMIPGDLNAASPNQFQHGIFGLQVSAGSQGNNANAQILQYNTNESAQMLAKKINTIQKYFVEQSRLGIPIIPFDESLHGLVREGATSFPQSIGMAASFNPALVGQVANAIADETRLRGIRQILSPVVNLASDVRWGRVEETYGEDPYLSSIMGVAYTSAFEKKGIIATPKHLLANVGDGGRDSYPIHWSKRFLEETHLVPFYSCVREANVQSMMTAYNLLDGRPSTANHWLLTDKVKKEWNFSGFFVSDASAVGGANVLHFTASDYEDASAQTMNAGLDVIFQTEYQHYKLFMPPFLDGRISKERINDAVARVLRAKIKLGLFENPYVSEEQLLALGKVNNKSLAEKMAVESLVLLQNKNQALPIAPKHKKILVIGPDAVDARLGGYAGPGNNKVSILDGLKKIASQRGVQVSYAKGFDWNVKSTEVVKKDFLPNGFEAAYFNNSMLRGEPAYTRKDAEINFHWTLYSPDPKRLKNDDYSIRWKGKLKAQANGTYQIGLRGNDGFRLYWNGRLLIDQWEKVGYSTILNAVELTKDQSYEVVIEFHETRGEAAIEFVWNYGIEDAKPEFQKALRMAREADYIVLATGIHEGEFQDRAFLTLPGNQEEFIHQVALLKKPITVLLTGGSAIKTTAWKDKVDAILSIWYPGEEGGHAIAKTLFGVETPSGKLPITFPIEEGQLPLVYNHHPTGRGNDYHDLSGEPLYPFGFGLSYTQFEFSNLRVNRDRLKASDTLEVTLSIKNTGSYSGSEVIQLYVKDLLSSISRPILELKCFEKVQLAPGQSKELHLRLPMQRLRFLNEQMQWVVEPGEFRVMVGNSSKNLPLKKNITVLE
ncbi:MAG: glycoside hydrolase family 3 N-terminal domain-containing protein [Cyclobacteriaceae bacterium]|jgi:beta-glucosidase|nr:glycoside hydrolase family 3 C-terminal domain-containing protein [Flammeovirgaceae bacterium]